MWTCGRVEKGEKGEISIPWNRRRWRDGEMGRWRDKRGREKEGKRKRERRRREEMISTLWRRGRGRRRELEISIL